MRRILITRPEPGATKTAIRLAKAGYDVVSVPLTKIVPLDGNLPSGSLDGIIATSAQAFRHLEAELIKTLSTLPVYVVGAATAHAAKTAGFFRVLLIERDIDALMLALKFHFNERSTLLYLCGKVRRPDFESALFETGVTVRVFEVYDTIAVSYSTDKLSDLIGINPFDAVVLSSAFSAQEMHRLWSTQVISQTIENAAYICISSRVADVISNARRGPVLIAETPDEDGIMRLLQTHFPC